MTDPQHVAPIEPVAPVQPVVPTQVRNPWRTTVRSAFQGLVTLAGVWGLIISAAGWDSAGPVIAGTIGFAAAITRIMALPAVNSFIDSFLPFLSAKPKSAE